MVPLQEEVSGFFAGSGDLLGCSRHRWGGCKIRDRLRSCRERSVDPSSGMPRVWGSTPPDMEVIPRWQPLSVIIAVHQLVDDTQAVMIKPGCACKDTTMPMVFSLVGFGY